MLSRICWHYWVIIAIAIIIRVDVMSNILWFFYSEWAGVFIFSSCCDSSSGFYDSISLRSRSAVMSVMLVSNTLIRKIVL